MNLNISFYVTIEKEQHGVLLAPVSLTLKTK